MSTASPPAALRPVPQMSPDLEVITRRPATACTDWAVEHAASFR